MSQMTREELKKQIIDKLKNNTISEFSINKISYPTPLDVIRHLAPTILKK